MPLTKRRQIAVKIPNHYVADGGKTIDPSVKTRGRINHQRSIGSPGRPHLNFETAFFRRDMIFQRIDRIIGGTDHFHFHLPHDTASGELGSRKFGVGLIPNGFGGGWIEQAIADTKRPLQFQVRPMVQGIAQAHRHRRCPGLKFFPIIRVAGNQPLSNAIPPHGAPFVVIAGEPEFGKIREARVLRDLLWRQMTMIVDDRLRFSVVVV